ncbi:acyl-CoA thioesterase [Metabacillus halosaccharovorans]|uniref:acyl-CoA thioesterase n=1 Tax=Metabacillus halosaccharovorans TaxID=930124 RepID=UPI001C1FD0E0|nr:acyl-CoA thioesterase [Metabacillus halosaccharovorans]MBU7591423.1 acyl-CoA thioesterase [Metabacillus halosaccharovorans]
MNNLLDGFCVTHDIQFHEVDSMNIVHHSQYILWLEKARFALAKKTLNFGMKDFERNGILLPVTKVECKYLRSIKLDQPIRIYVKLVESESALVKFIYEVYEKDTQVKFAEATTEQAFVNKDGKLLLNQPELWVEGVKKIKTEFPTYIVGQ